MRPGVPAASGGSTCCAPAIRVPAWPAACGGGTAGRSLRPQTLGLGFVEPNPSVLFFFDSRSIFFYSFDLRTNPSFPHSIHTLNLTLDAIVNIFGSSVSRSVGFFIFFSLQVLQHILDLGKLEHREGEKRDPRRHWSSIRPSLVRWCRSALGGDGRSSGRRRVAGDVEVDGGVV